MSGRKIKVKVCGMRDAENLQTIAALKPDYIGLIFYARSPRYVTPAQAEALPEFNGIKKIGVFVDEAIESIAEIARRAKLTAIQLHGGEPVEYCAEVKKRMPQVELIKAFPVNEDFDGSLLRIYEETCDRFLFDTKTDAHGGSGKAFNWNVLRSTAIARPFFLGGGISEMNFRDAIAACEGLPLHAIDLNSRVETAPGLKSAAAVRNIITSL